MQVKLKMFQQAALSLHIVMILLQTRHWNCA
jgi:hypothetical protein